jgi:hypothetical protein
MQRQVECFVVSSHVSTFWNALIQEHRTAAAFRSNHVGYTVILNNFVYLHQFNVDVCVWMVICLAKHFTRFLIKMEEAKMRPVPESLILILSQKLLIVISCSLLVAHQIFKIGLFTSLFAPIHSFIHLFTSICFYPFK